MRVHQIFSLVLVLLLFSLPVSALSLNGQKISPIIYEPNKQVSNHYSISDTDAEVAVEVTGDFSQDVTLTPAVNHEFDFFLKFPEELPPVGTYWLALTVKEVSKNSPASNLGSLLSVTKMFQIEVYSKEKEIQASLDAPNVNPGEKVNFNLQVSSRCYQDIDAVKGEITVYDLSGKELGKAFTPERLLKAFASEALTASFDASNLPPAEYLAKAVVSYDGKQKEVNDTFKVGAMNLKVLNYTSLLNGGFSEFKLRVASLWNKELKNVYAQAFVGEQMLLQTPVVDFAPMGEAELGGIMKVELAPGKYPGKIKLFFGEQVKELGVEWEVVKSTSAGEASSSKNGLSSSGSGNFGWVTILLAVIILALLLVLAYFVKNQRKRKDEL